VDNADEITVELVPEPTDDVRALIGELDRILSAEYTPEQRHGLALDAIFKPDIRFFLARSKGAAVGCGGVAFFTDFAEVKRMYVRDTARGSGAARGCLRELRKRPATRELFCSGSRREHVRQRRSVSMSERGFNPAQHSAPTLQWHLRPSPPVCSCKSNSELKPKIGRSMQPPSGPHQGAGLRRVRLGLAGEMACGLLAARPASAKVVNCSATSCTLKRPCGSYHL
jgi:hypothetical protein